MARVGRPFTAGARRAFSQVVFDTAFKALQRERVAAVRARLLDQIDAGEVGGKDVEALREKAFRYEYLRDEVADRLVDRLNDLDGSRAIADAADVGCWGGHVARAIAEHQQMHTRDKGVAGRHQGNIIQSLVQLDQSEGMLDLARRQQPQGASFSTTYEGIPDCAGGTEHLALEDHSFDVVFSSMWLHWCNNLPSLLTQIRRSLRPDGLFLGAMLGGDTLSQLRSALVLAEQDVLGGVSARVSPLVHVGDVGMLLQGAGFSIPTVDTDLITVEYPNPRILMKHLQGMGESNASALRQRGALRRDVLDKAVEHYTNRYGNPSDDGAVPATFQVIYMIGWAPSADQPRPMARGTQDVSLADLKKELAGIQTIPSAPPPAE
eukprot:g3712.t1